MLQRGRTRRVTGVDFSHFNLAMRCLASGGGGEGGCWGCIERPSYIHLSPPTHSPPSLSRRSSRPPAPSSFPLFPPTFVAFHPFRPFSNLLCLFHLLLLHLLLRLYHPLPSTSRATSRPSFATHLPRPPFPQPPLTIILFSTPTPFRPLSLPPPSRAVSLPLPLSLGLYLEMLPPTNKPQTLRSFTQS